MYSGVNPFQNWRVATDFVWRFRRVSPVEGKASPVEGKPYGSLLRGQKRCGNFESTKAFCFYPHHAKDVPRK